MFITHENTAIMDVTASKLNPNLKTLSNISVNQILYQKPTIKQLPKAPAEEDEDPLSLNNLPTNKIIKENLTIRTDDETRIVGAMSKAVKKQTTGSIYSIKVNIGKTGTLGIGVKDLADSILAVSMLKRENGNPGAGEEAGLRLGDIIFGINFMPTRDGSHTLISTIRSETEKGRNIIHIQGWRCHQLCSDSIPGFVFPRADDVIVQAYALYSSKVFSDWERWNFVEILLGHMIEDLKLRAKLETCLDAISPTSSMQSLSSSSSSSTPKAKQMQVLDLEKNILQAKGLRTALCVRIVNAKNYQGDSVVYILRVEDVESGLNWVIQKRYRDFFALNDELIDMSQFVKEIEFPKKRMTLRITARLVENRIIALEQYIRKLLHTLTVYASMDAAASRSLRHLQHFLGVDKFLDCIHPPIVDDQRYVELMAYRFLNDFNSPACQQCVRFTSTVDLESLVDPGEEGYKSVLNHIRAALAEVEQFVLQQHQQQMVQSLRQRNPDLPLDIIRSFVRKCVRRQVEASLYLPLRRSIYRIVYSFLAEKSKGMLRALRLLQDAPCNTLMIDPYTPHAKALPSTIKAFRKLMTAYLPADQGQLLIEAAQAVVELHKEVSRESTRRKRFHTSDAAVRSLPSQTNSTASLSNRPSSTDAIPSEVMNAADFNDNSIPGIHTINRIAAEGVNAIESANAMVSTLLKPASMHTLKTVLLKSFKETIMNGNISFNKASESHRTSENEGTETPPYSGEDNEADITNEDCEDVENSLRIRNSNSDVIPDPSTLHLEDHDTSPNKANLITFTKSIESTDDGSVHPFHSRSVLNSRSLSIDNCINNHEMDNNQNGKEFTEKMNRKNGNSNGISGMTINRLGLNYFFRSSSPDSNQSSSLADGKSNTAKSRKGDAKNITTTEEDEDAILLEDGSAVHVSNVSNFMDGRFVNGSTIQPTTTDSSQSMRINYSLDEGLASTARDARTIEFILKNYHQRRNNQHNQTSDSPSRSKSVSSPRPPVLGLSSNKSTVSDTFNVDNGVPTPHSDKTSRPDRKPDTIEEENSEDFSESNRIQPGSIISTEANQMNKVVDHSPSETDLNRQINSKPSNDSLIYNLVPTNSTETIPMDQTKVTSEIKESLVSADDFLPLFTYALVQTNVPQLILVKELMVTLIDDEDAYGECGYYLATLEASIQHIMDLAEQYEKEIENDRKNEESSEFLF